MSCASSDIPPPLRNTLIRSVALIAFAVSMAVSMAAAFHLASVPDGFYSFAGSIVLGWMFASKGGEVATYYHSKNAE